MFREAFRLLGATVRLGWTDQPIRSLTVTSPAEKEGKSTVAFNLAMAAIEAGQRVVLVEADTYRPSLHPLVDRYDPGRRVPTVPGLVDYLTGHVSLDAVIHPTGHPSLSFVPAGPRPVGSMVQLLEADAGRRFVYELAADADLVLFDCPPIGQRADGVILATRTDAVLLVVDLKVSTRRIIEDSLRRFPAGLALLIGAVVNRDSTIASTQYRYADREATVRPGREDYHVELKSAGSSISRRRHG
jgi:Mrp family chromosome partitioning ATPase